MKSFVALCLSALLLAFASVAHAVDTEAEAEALKTVTFAFIKASREQQPHAAWVDGMEHGDLSVFPASSQTLKTAEFAPVRPFVKKDGEFYIANVSTKGDAKQQPVYLYLLAKHGQKTEVVAAFHIQHGQAETIAF